ncbi:hypothetical protein FACS189472_18800 [Alphaproteobacteria bacterium]|nr:hypothetical protein FACS189472_18800 [Alphaproteobacteria bacterium]
MEKVASEVENKKNCFGDRFELIPLCHITCFSTFTKFPTNTQTK